MIATMTEESVDYATIERYPGYRFGSDGSIWSCWQRFGGGKSLVQKRLSDRWRLLSPTAGSKGYLFVRLCENGGAAGRILLVHRLILEAFNGPCPDGCEARHYPDGTRSNCSIGNLVWGTRSENFHDKWEQGTMPHGEKHHNATLTDLQVAEIRERKAAGETLKTLADEFGVHLGTIWNLVNGRSRR